MQYVIAGIKIDYWLSRLFIRPKLARRCALTLKRKNGTLHLLFPISIYGTQKDHTKTYRMMYAPKLSTNVFRTRSLVFAKGPFNVICWCYILFARAHKHFLSTFHSSCTYIVWFLNMGTPDCYRGHLACCKATKPKRLILSDFAVKFKTFCVLIGLWL